MGAWGTAAWDNDAAADWFGDFFDKTKLAEVVETTLNGDVEEDYDEIRAAAYVLVALGINYIWPIDRMENDLRLAVDKLEAIKVVQPELSDAIEEELSVLRSRLKPPDQ